ncbi:MAG: methyltransferase domain-containing protein [Bacteroidota bacterium]
MKTVPSNSTIVIGDLKGSSAKMFNIIALLKIIGINLNKEDALAYNTSGDGFIIAFKTSEEALKFALKVRDSFRHHDWRAEDILSTPLLRIAISAGTILWEKNNKGTLDIQTAIGTPIVEAARIEPITNPGDVYVTNVVRELAGNQLFYFHDLGKRTLPKNFGEINLFRAHWLNEKDAIIDGRVGPLFDNQYYRRSQALRRFAYLWLTLDQLPIGCWGRSISHWMNEVWRDDPDIMTTPIIEDEGGFETTIFNLELLSHLTGQDTIVSSSGNGWRAIEYLKKRNSPKGFGTLGYSRQGYSIEPHPRHTALVGWLLGTIYESETLKVPDLQNLFTSSVRSLFIGDQTTIAQEFEQDRNPLVLYLACWHIIQQLKTSEFLRFFPKKELRQIIDNWNKCSKALCEKALIRTYDKPRPEALAKKGTNIYPLTIPYGEFIRMESYSLLSSVLLIDPQMPTELLLRMKEGVHHVILEYLHEWEDPIKRYTRDYLRPVVCGPKAHFRKNPASHPDIGTAAMLLRVLRTKNIIDTLWGGSLPPDAIKARYLISEDLVQLFDRYLSEPRLFALTHPGMLAGVLVGDGPSLLEDVIRNCSNVIINPLPNILSDETINAVLSERKIEELLTDIVANDSSTPGIQIATHSLARLLVDRLRPGRYVRESLSIEGIKSISQTTLNVYANPSFAEKFNSTWGAIPDLAIIAPFLRLINNNSKILDVGCGPGQYAAEFYKNGHDVAILDASKPMLTMASERLHQITGNYPNMIQCNILDAISRSNEVIPNSFDAIWCSGLFVHIPKEEQSIVLKWFYGLLRPNGYLFVNINLDNPRLFARDGRYFGYISDPRSFEMILDKCKFQTEYVVQTKVKRNTYGEPFLETVWTNYYAKKYMIDDVTTNSLRNDNNNASTLTALAYARSAIDYRKSHGVTSADRLKTIKIYLDKLKSLLSPSIDTPCVLDAGCGPGDYTTQMALQGWNAIGIDMSETSIQLAREACPQQLQGRATFSVGDMRKLPATWSNKFNAILCITAFQHIPIDGGDARQVLNEFARVLESNGVLRIDIQLGRETGFDPDLRFIQGYRDSNKIMSLLEQSGFIVVDKNEWELAPSNNTFQRPIPFRFLELWCRKQ